MLKGKGLKRSRSKSRIPLEENVDELFSLAGSENRILFLTLTGKEKIWDRKELQKRWNSFTTGVLRLYVLCGVMVPEQHKDGSFHAHAVILLPWSYKWTPDCWHAIDHHNYTHIDCNLRWFWNHMRERMWYYGFGRFEALPPKKGRLAMSRYLSKYLTKSLDLRLNDRRMKGMRLVRYINNLQPHRIKDGEQILRTFFVPPSLAPDKAVLPKRNRIKLKVMERLKGKKSAKAVLAFCEYAMLTAPLRYWRRATCQYGSPVGGKKWRWWLSYAEFAFKKNGWVLDETIIPRIATGAVWRYGPPLPDSKWGYRLMNLMGAFDTVHDFTRSLAYSFMNAFRVYPLHCPFHLPSISIKRTAVFEAIQRDDERRRSFGLST